MSAAGYFITLEGIDGAGKSTHLQRMAQWLADKGHKVVQTREPGGTPLGETLRELVLHQAMDGLSEALLVFAARRHHVQSVIRPALAQGKVVLCDRFTDASFAYQGAGQGLSLDVLKPLEAWVQEGLQPNTTFWFDAPPAMAAARRRAARAPDKFERQDEAFFQRVRHGYAERQTLDAKRFVVLDASGSVETVWRHIEQALEERF